MSLCLSGVIYAMVRPVFHAIEENTHIELISLLVSAVAVTVAVTSLVFFMSHSISDVLPSMLSGSALTSMQKILQSLLLVFGSGLLLTACYDMARKKNIRRETRFIQFLACAAVGLVIVSMDIISISSGISLVVALMLLSVFILLYYSRDWLMEACILLISLTTLLIQHADVMLHHVLSTGWWGLAGLGMMTIVGSALMERFTSSQSPEVLTHQN